MMVIDELLSKIAFHVDAAPLAALKKTVHDAAHSIQHAFSHGAEGSIEHLGEKIEGVNKKLELFGAVEVIKGLFELTERFSEFAEQLTASAASAGITVEALQGLQFSAAASAVSADVVSTSMARLSRSLYEARTGSQEAQQAFAQAGISREQVAGFKNGQQALEALADQMKGMSDPIAKEALAMKLLGRGGHQTVAWLSKGGAAMREMGVEAEETGAIISGEQVEALEEAAHAGHMLAQVMKALGATFAADLAPSIRDAIHSFLEFYKAHRQLAATSLNKWANEIMYALGFVWGVMKSVISRFLKFAEAHQELVDWGLKWTAVIYGSALVLGLLGFALGLLMAPLKNFISLLVTVWTVGSRSFSIMLLPLSALRKALGQVLLKLAVMTATAFPALSEAALAAAAALEASWVAALGPVLLVIAAFAAGYAIGHDLYILFTGGSLKDTWLGQAIDYVTELTKKVGRFLGLVDEKPDVELKKYGEDDQVGKFQPGYSTGVPKSLAKPATYDEALEQQLAQSQLDVDKKFANIQGMVNQDPSSQMMGDPVKLAVAAKDYQDAARAAEAGKAGGTSAQESIAINAPITIHAPPGATSKDMENIAKKVVDQQLTTAMREAQRSTRPAAHY